MRFYLRAYIFAHIKTLSFVLFMGLFLYEKVCESKVPSSLAWDKHQEMTLGGDTHPPPFSSKAIHQG